MRYALPAAILALGLGLSACQPTVVETNDPPAVVVAPGAPGPEGPPGPPGDPGATVITPAPSDTKVTIEKT